MSTAGAAHRPRKIWICADDYGLAPGVNDAIRRVLTAGRINATSVMVLPRALDADAASALRAIREKIPSIAVGLHVTLTAPFRPMTAGFAPLRDGDFLPVKETLRAAARRRFRKEALIEEVAAQLRAFVAAFGRPPDFIDGHQHVQLFPQIRDAVLAVAQIHAPQAWVRQCGRTASLMQRLRDRKGLLLDILSVRFRRKAARLGVATNPAFAGTYDFSPGADFARLFPQFLDSLPDGGLVMCHPGFVDDALKRLDPLTALRQREYDFFMADGFPKLLAAQNIHLA